MHFFNHASPHDHYIMGVTLSAGDALEWFRKTFASQTSYSELMHLASQSVPGANGLLFAPYINGERMPHTDAKARGSFIGIDRQHTLEDFARAVVEGITYSLNDCLQFMHVDQVIAIGGGARSSFWLQMQADIFNRPVITRASEQGPGYGAAIIATVGCGWYSSLKECARDYLTISSTYQPSNEYGKAFKTFQEVYNATKLMNDQLTDFRKSLK
nr:FGGY-family carbohydrate kinase [Geomicrobium sp. JCM 19039]